MLFSATLEWRRKMLIELHQNVSRWTAKYKKAWVRHWWGVLHAGHFLFYFFPPPPFRRRSSGPRWLTFWTCGDWWALCPWQDQDWMAKGKMQLFHIDKQGTKCHLQHVEIDAVIRFKSTSHYWTPMAGLVKRVSTYKKKKKENKMRECRYISPQQISIKI